MAVDFQNAHLPAVFVRNAQTAREGIWRKLRRFAGHIPFAEDLVAAYYCGFDSRTPLSARAALLAAVAYFVVPVDLIPDAIIGLGFTDDATALATAIAIAGAYVRPEHRDAAKRALLKPTP